MRSERKWIMAHSRERRRKGRTRRRARRQRTSEQHCQAQRMKRWMRRQRARRDAVGVKASVVDVADRAHRQQWTSDALVRCAVAAALIDVADCR